MQTNSLIVIALKGKNERYIPMNREGVDFETTWLLWCEGDSVKGVYAPTVIVCHVS